MFHEGRANIRHDRFFNFYWEYSCFTMLCQFLLYNKVNQLCVYLYVLVWEFASHLGHHRALGKSSLSCTIGSQYLLSILYIASLVYIPQSQSLNSPHPSFPLGICIYVLRSFISVLQIRSSIPFVRSSQVAQW